MNTFEYYIYDIYNKQSSTLELTKKLRQPFASMTFCKYFLSQHRPCIDLKVIQT